MTGRHALGLVIVLALLAMAGIVGMLLAIRCWDGLFFLMTAAPLILGAGLWTQHRRGRLNSA